MLLNRSQPPKTTPARYLTTTQAAAVASQKRHNPTPAPPSVSQLAWFLCKEPAKLTPEEKANLQRIQGEETVAALYLLVQQFADMIRRHVSDTLDSWLQACSDSGVSCLRTFALGISQDYAAVRAALEKPWSNGQVEGQVNRLKFIKRQMYGRASFDLLRLRVLHPQ